MRLIEFAAQEGFPVWINPEHVTELFPSLTTEGVTIIIMGTEREAVVCDHNEVAEFVIGGTS